MSLAFIFPGQGAQYAGMGKDVYDNFPAARKIFAQADEALGFAVSELCFNGPEEELRLTVNTQPAILTVSVALCAVLNEKGVRPDTAAGHSLGEYSALVAAGVIDFTDAVRIVRERGRLMQESVPVGEGAMAAVMGMSDNKIVEICRTLENAGHMVQAVNFNCPGQVVIAGAAAAVLLAIDRLKESGAKRAMLLPVSAPFHSTLLLPAARKLGEFLNGIEFHDARIPVYSNVTGQAASDKDEIRALLIKQAASPVLWTSLTRSMAENGVETFMEVGPGKTLCGFTRKIIPDALAVNVSDVQSLEKTSHTLRR
ncbi:MAG: ACP S-malonyltransferase [Acidaminococcales bacterium]|jgi:[acyl-carrier-protein] S-malonyltransferase|nr:ACP S-malonyltransferase [Acidaminococcales bacterium]